jgi:hypothetical protein
VFEKEFKRLLTGGMFLLAASFVLLESAASEIDPRDYTVELTAQGPAPVITLKWPSDSFASSYKISRKILGASTWNQLSILPANASSFVDNVPVGSAFEYEVEERTTYNINAYGYLYAGNSSVPPALRGTVILIVDQTFAGDLAFELGQLEQDLIGDGWSVRRHDVARNASVGSVRDLIRADYYADPANVKSVFLFGHVPVPYSGNINPDLHAGHKGAWPADVYYADIDGNWSDSTVYNTDAEESRNFNVPGDGKFDQSFIPSPVELEIGRVDLFDMPAFLPLTEKDLLRQYLVKDHRFRFKQLTASSRALVHDNFGEIEGDAPVIDAWRNFPGFVGLENIRTIGPDQFFDVLANDSYLWAYGAGGGGWDKADGVGSTYDFARRDPKAIFTILHGSYFGDWDFPDNFTKAPLATTTYGLACIWAGLPHWFMHPMALGESLGYITKLNQNNVNGLYKSAVNLSSGQVHISLMGDPTLRMQVVAPPNGLTAQNAQGVVLNWGAAPDSILGYNIYRSDNAKGPFTKLNRSYITTTTYTDLSSGAGLQTYLVRAVKLETTPSGSFLNTSQGVFTSINVSSIPGLPSVTIQAIDNEGREADGDPAVFAVRRSAAGTGALTVFLAVGGSANNGQDYQKVNSSVVIPAGQVETRITISPIQDSAEEGSETVILSLVNNAAYQVAGPNSAQVLILDTPIDHPPTISQIPDQTMAEGSSPGPISVTIADPETSPFDLTLSATSSNANLVGPEDITLSGSGGVRVLSLKPKVAQHGTASITLTVRAGQLQASTSFVLTVTPINLPPPRISSVRLSSGNPPELLFNGVSGKAWTIERSSDLLSWTPVGNGTALNDQSILFKDTLASSTNRSFYRLLWR